MHKKMFPVMIILSATVTLAGCSSITPQKQTELPEKAEKIIIQDETETQPETQPQTETEKMYSLKDIQVSVEKTGRKGNIHLQLEDSNGVKEISQNFISTPKAFLSIDDNGSGAYMDEDSSMYEKDGLWLDSEGAYKDIFSFIYSSDCVKEEDTVIDNTPCFHISCDVDDTIGLLLAYCHTNEYSELIEGSTAFNYYINKNTYEIVRVDLSMPFLATAGDGSNEKGELYGTILVTGLSEEQVTKPVAEKKADTDKSDIKYVPGEILAENNTYKNQTFSLQVIGKDLFVFDVAKTEELKTNYEQSGSSYQEEAYGSGEGVIINISSIKSMGASTETVLKKYLSDSAAEGVQQENNISFAGNQYAIMTSMINQTLTKSYATGINGRVLIITLYYTEESTVTMFEKNNIYNISDNPLWEAGTWTLEGKYQITTPNGYSIVQSESGDLFVCMVSSTDEMNVFAIENESVEDEAVSESQTSGNTTRELKEQEDITLNDGSVMKYYVVYNSEPNLNYYTYVGLLQKDTAVIKFYLVSTAGNADYKKIYAEAANSVSVITDSQDSESAEPGTDVVTAEGTSESTEKTSGEEITQE